MFTAAVDQAIRSMTYPDIASRASATAGLDKDLTRPHSARIVQETIEACPPIKLSQVEYRSVLYFDANGQIFGPVETVWQAETALEVCIKHPLRAEAERLARETYRFKVRELEMQLARDAIDRAKQELQRLFNTGIF